MARPQDLGRDSRDYRQPCTATGVSTVRLPDATWRQSAGLKAVVAALSDGDERPRIVGGAVRDSLLGLSVSDVDLATRYHPDMVIDRLEAARIKAIPTGIGHGTITAISHGQSYEITTLRRDVSTDGRHATIEFASDWQEDAARRDFTINALYADPVTSEIFDYFGGLEDIKTHVIRFIGEPAERIAEDHLRILRYFRFLARFGGDCADTAALKACKNAAKSLMALSRERIAGELIKILMLPDPLFAVTLMINNGIFASFLPELSSNAQVSLKRLIDREAEHHTDISLPARLLSILLADGAIVDKLAMRLKLSSRIRIDLANRLLDQSPTPGTMRAIAYYQDVSCARDSALLFADDELLPECLAILTNWSVPVFPIKGGDLIALGLTAGPVVAKTLKQIEAAWVSEDFPDIDRTNKLTGQLVAGALLATKNS
jgi:poly(A) polymerase